MGAAGNFFLQISRGTKVFHGENQSWPTRRAEHVGALGSLRITREGDWIPQGLQEAASGGAQAVMLPAAVGEPSLKTRNTAALDAISECSDEDDKLEASVVAG